MHPQVKFICIHLLVYHTVTVKVKLLSAHPATKKLLNKVMSLWYETLVSKNVCVWGGGGWGGVGCADNDFTVTVTVRHSVSANTH